MYDIFKENLKWIILGLSIIGVVSSIASCRVAIVKSYTENGYVQKKTSNNYILWTKPNEPTMIEKSKQ